MATLPSPTISSPTARRSGHRRQAGRPLTIVASAVVAVATMAGGLVGCGEAATSTTGSSTITPVAVAELAAVTDTSTTTTTTTPMNVDASADLATVAVAGECVTVTSTPPSASVAQLADLCMPEGRVEDTAIVLVHGGAGVGGSRTDLAAWQQWYSDHGYLTLSVDYALVDPETDDGLYPLPEQNVKAGVQYLRKVGESLGVDSIVIQGHSAGARLAAIVATTGDDAGFVGPELWAGVSDSVDGTIGFYGYYDGAQFNGEAYFGGDGTPADGSSPVSAAAQVDGWTLLVHGTADSIVEVGASEDYAAALESAGASVDLIEIDGAEHGLDGYDTVGLTVVGEQLAEVIVETIVENNSV